MLLIIILPLIIILFLPLPLIFPPTQLNHNILPTRQHPHHLQPALAHQLLQLINSKQVVVAGEYFAFLGGFALLFLGGENSFVLGLVGEGEVLGAGRGGLVGGEAVVQKNVLDGVLGGFGLVVEDGDIHHPTSPLYHPPGLLQAPHPIPLTTKMMQHGHQQHHIKTLIPETQPHPVHQHLLINWEHHLASLYADVGYVARSKVFLVLAVAAAYV